MGRPGIQCVADHQSYLTLFVDVSYVLYTGGDSPIAMQCFGNEEELIRDVADIRTCSFESIPVLYRIIGYAPLGSGRPFIMSTMQFV
jgi:hypothetical protein